MSPWRRVAIAMAVAILAAAADAGAQTMRGQVFDSVTAEPIGGIEIVVIDAAGDTAAVAKSDREGRFAVAVPIGSYTVRCRCLGHRPKETQVDFDGENYVTIRLAPIIIPQ